MVRKSARLFRAVRSLAILLAIALVGLFIHDAWLAIIGFAGAGIVVILRLVGNRGAAPSAWGLTALFALISCSLLALLIWSLAFAHGPLSIRLCTLIFVFPILFFVYISLGSGYFAVTGHRHPLAYRIGRWMGRIDSALNKNLSSRS